MKLSAAIRAGSQLTEQVKVVYLQEDPETGKICGACAMGAAWVGLHGVEKRGIPYVSAELTSHWPEIAQARHPHPVTGNPVSLYYSIVTLNDDHGWTREQIADWLEKEGF